MSFKKSRLKFKTLIKNLLQQRDNKIYFEDACALKIRQFRCLCSDFIKNVIRECEELLKKKISMVSSCKFYIKLLKAAW